MLLTMQTVKRLAWAQGKCLGLGIHGHPWAGKMLTGVRHSTFTQLHTHLCGLLMLLLLSMHVECAVTIEYLKRNISHSHSSF